MSTTSNDQHTSPNGVKLLAGVVLGEAGVAAALETSTGPESVSALVLGLSAFSGLVAGAADDIDPLRRALERGYWVIAGLAIFVLLLIVGANESAAPLAIGFALAFGGGVVVSTIGTVVVESIYPTGVRDRSTFDRSSRRGALIDETRSVPHSLYRFAR